MEHGFTQDFVGAPPAADTIRSYRCELCGIRREWKYVGDTPSKCRPCARAWNNRVNAEAVIIGSTSYDTVMDAVDARMHWDQSIGRWLACEGERWGRITDNDAYTTMKALLRGIGADHGPEAVEAMLHLFKHHCTNRHQHGHDT